MLILWLSVFDRTASRCVSIYLQQMFILSIHGCALSHTTSPFTFMSLHVLCKCMQTLVCMCVCVLSQCGADQLKQGD